MQVEPPLLRKFYLTRVPLTAYQLLDRNRYFVCDDLGQAVMVSTEVLNLDFEDAI